MTSYRIALYPGDGIGLEVTAEAVRVLQAAAQAFGFGLDLTEFDWGHRYYARTGQVAPSDFLTILKDFEAIYLGAVGDPASLPDHLTLAPLIQMRQGFDQYVCLRPAKLLPHVATPLAGKRPGDIDMVIVRENSEGEYFDAGATFRPGQVAEVAIQTSIHSRLGVERILRYSFELARTRRKRLTLATKSNALRHSMVLWDRILDELKPAYPDVAVDKWHIDALCLNFVLKPESYDVVVGSNLFGDILSDLGGAIVGSLGLAPSANLNPERRYPSLFEPVHGSAPDIAGRGIANPLAAIRAAGMMLDFLGQAGAGRAVEAAVVANLAEGRVRTPDLGGQATCAQVGQDVAGRLARLK
jgi:tartrate dehydrogenase/decarboxylase/D-malate dehydrogenase